MSKRRIKPRTYENPGTPTRVGDDPSYPLDPVLPRKPDHDIISWLAWWLSQFGQPNGSDNPNSRGGSGDPNTRGYDDGSSSGSRGGSGDPNNRGFGDGDPIIRGGTGAQPSTTTWAQWLQNLGLYDQYASLLAGFGFDLNASPTDAQKSDWQKQLMDMILQHIADQENRDYTRSILEEQRNYDSPLSQLFRLTGAGIGRDAAIQALSGVQQPTVGAQATIPQGIMPSESAANDLNNKLGIANAVFNAFGTLSSLVSAGVSLGSAIPQIQALQAANYMSDQQKSAYNSTRNFAQAIGSLTSSGALSLSAVNACSNADDLANLVRSSSNPSVQQLANSRDFSNVFNTPFGREQMNCYWSAVRDSRDAGTRLDEFIRSSKLNNALTAMNIDKVGAEIDQIDANTVFSRAQTEQVFANIVLTGAQVDQANALASLYQEQVETQELTNDNLRLEYDLNSTGFPMLKQNRLDEIEEEFYRWSVISDPKVRDERILKWLREEMNANNAEYLKQLYLNAAGSFAQNAPNTYNFLVGLKSVGLFDKLQSAAKTGANAASMLLFKKPL